MADLDPNEAPEGFYAVEKIYKGYNICRDCDARDLCINNIDDWCRKNRCMSDALLYDDGELIKRNDGKSVIFKFRQQLQLF